MSQSDAPRQSQPLIQIIDFKFIHQIVDQWHQYLQLRIYMHHKERSEATNRIDVP